MNIKSYMNDLGKNAKKASNQLTAASTDKKNRFLYRLSELLVKHTEDIVKANLLDLNEAKKNSLDNAFIDRLTLNKKIF